MVSAALCAARSPRACARRRPAMGAYACASCAPGSRTSERGSSVASPRTRGLERERSWRLSHTAPPVIALRWSPAPRAAGRAAVAADVAATRIPLVSSASHSAPFACLRRCASPLRSPHGSRSRRDHLPLHTRGGVLTELVLILSKVTRWLI